MPYFERKTWEDANAITHAVPAVAPEQDVDFAQAASAILDSEKRRKAGEQQVFCNRHPARPGTTAEISLSIAADGQGGAVSLQLSSSDLASASGARIASGAVSLTPNPLEIPPGGRTVLRIRVSVPQSAKPGRYAGQLTGRGSDPWSGGIEIVVSES